MVVDSVTMAGRGKKERVILAVAVAASVIGTAALFLYGKWLSGFLENVSTSIEGNSLLIVGWMMLLLVVSFAEAFILRAIHRALSAEEGRVVSGRDEVAKEIARKVKETKVLWTVYVTIPVIFNLLVASYLGTSFGLVGMFGQGRYVTIATMLRSPDTETRMAGIEEAIASEDRRLGPLLAGIIAGKGPLSAEAAWAAGLRKDGAARQPLRKLYREGNERQRSAAILALAALRDSEIVSEVVADLSTGKGPKLSLLLALGELGRPEGEETLAAVCADERESPMVRAACFAAVSKIEQERFRAAWEKDSLMVGFNPKRWRPPPRRGWEPMMRVLETGSDPILKCGAVQALRYTGPPEVSRPLMQLFDSSDRFAKCNRITVKPFRYKEYEVVRGGLLRSFILAALAGIGDRSIVGWLDSVAADRSNADEVILIARDLARQIRSLK